MRLSAGLSSRLGAIVLVLAFVALSVALSASYATAPDWLVYGDAACFVAIVGIAAVAPRGSLWRRLERPAALATIGLAFAFIAASLAKIVDRLMFAPQTLKPLALFQTSVGLWFANILIFTLAYWLIDAGGPDARESNSPAYADFDFPARSDPSKVEPGWQPTIMDYLFLAFTTNTAFGPTEAMPLTARAKALLIVQSLISLVTVAGVAARAIGATS